MQEEEKKIMGHTEEEIKASFRKEQQLPNITEKIWTDKSTLEILIEGEKALTEEEKEYLEDIYKK